MANPPPLTDDERQQIRDLHAAGKSCSAIARQLGRSPSTISIAAARMGLGWDRAQTKNATEARMADAAARRAQLANLLLDDALKMRAQLWEPCIAFNFGGRDNTYNEHELKKPDFAAQEKILRSVGVAVDKSLRLVDYDTGDDAAKIGSLLGGLLGDLQARHGTGD